MSNIVLEALQDKKRVLQAQLDEVQAAIRQHSNPLAEPQWAGAQVKTASGKKRKKAKRHMSAEAREKMRQMMLKRWAEKKAASKRPTQAQGGKKGAKTGAPGRPASSVSSESAA